MLVAGRLRVCAPRELRCGEQWENTSLASYQECLLDIAQLVIRFKTILTKQAHLQGRSLLGTSRSTAAESRCDSVHAAFTKTMGKFLHQCHCTVNCSFPLVGSIEDRGLTVSEKTEYCRLGA